MSTRYICIHGHFYQPPRENPWLESIEVQESAYPFHDWNERITAECYAPNASARILDERGYITRIVSNYARMSFNFGPTLLSWLERHRKDVYRSIIAADAQSRKRFSGHGSAIAQAYNHSILPLASRRDKRTQIRWGIRDFEHRFARRPEGMWLPETAVDDETLELLADEGIVFTLLAPHQAGSTRPPGEKRGATPAASASSASVRTRRARQRTEARDLLLHGPTSQANRVRALVARGEAFATRLQPASTAARTAARARRNRWRDVRPPPSVRRHSLAFALQHLEASGAVRLTNYADFLSLHPPTTSARRQLARRGAVRTASSAGAATVAATAAVTPATTAAGAPPQALAGSRFASTPRT